MRKTCHVSRNHTNVTEEMCKVTEMDKETTNCFMHISQSSPVAQKVNPPIDDSIIFRINLEELNFEAKG